MSRRRVIAVAGNIGAGKSSLVAWLHHNFGMVPFFEPNDENPYLADFYGDMPRWAFSSQLFFLVKRFEIHRAIERSLDKDQVIVQDRTLYEDAEIFAAYHQRAGNIDPRDWAMYQDVYHALKTELRPPDLMIYLRCPIRTLTQRIKRRGRVFEQGIPTSYLRTLDTLYEQWFSSYALSPTMVLETGQLNYVERLFDRLELRQMIEQYLKT